MLVAFIYANLLGPYAQLYALHSMQTALLQNPHLCWKGEMENK